MMDTLKFSGGDYFQARGEFYTFATTSHGSRIKPDARANPERRNLPSIFGSTALSEHQALFFPAFTFAHRALCAAAIFLRETAESFRLLRIGTILSALPAFALTFVQRAFWAAAIRA
jgi:hypothetical protein